MGETVRLATRGSMLALRQANTIRRVLERRNHTVEIRQVETTGDRLDDQLISQLGKTGAFVRALDEEVMAGTADLAVHSMKDVPTEMPEELVVAGVPDRAPAGDLLVRPAGAATEATGTDRRLPPGEANPVAALPTGARVGTSSLRRQAQLLAERPDLSVEPLRGNVDTRLQKLVAPGLQLAHERRLAAAGRLPGQGDDSEDAATEPSESDVEGAESGTERDDADAKGDGVEPVGADGLDAETFGDGSDTLDPDEAYDVDEDSFERSPSEWFEDLTELERSAMGRSVEPAYDAIVLAEAGLTRADLRDHPAVTVERLPRSTFVPAPGQGALAVTATAPAVIDAVRTALDHPPTRVTTTVERTVLATLGGGCVAPIGVHALLQGKRVSCRVRVSNRDGTTEVAETQELPVERHAAAAAEFAESLREQGAAELISQARRDQPDAAKRVD